MRMCIRENENLLEALASLSAVGIFLNRQELRKMAESVDSYQLGSILCAISIGATIWLESKFMNAVTMCHSAGFGPVTSL